MPMSLSSVSSGFDVELMLGSGALRHILQLFMDLGAIPRQVTQGTITIDVGAFQDVRRTYEAYPGTDYARETGDAFEIETYDFSSDDPDHVYLSTTIDIGPLMKLYFRIARNLDVADEVERLKAYIAEERDEDGEKIEFDILRIVKAVAMLPATQEYDAANPANNANPVFQVVLDDLNDGLQAFESGLKAGQNARVLDFLEAQLDPFRPARLKRIAFKPFPATSMGLYINFDLLDHDKGHLGARGDLDMAEDFLPDDADFALGTAPGFLGHLVNDVLLRMLLQYQVAEENLSEEEALAIFDGNHYPALVPDALVLDERKDGEPRDTVLAFEITGISVSTTSHSFEDEDGIKTRARSLKVKIRTNESLWRFIGLADENIVVFFTPLDGELEGLTVADLGIDTNLRVALVQTLFETFVATVAFWPLAALRTLLMPVIGVINLLANKSIDEDYRGRLSEHFGIEVLSWLPLLPRRWDPFYETNHGLLIEKQSLFFDDERLFLGGRIHLARRPAAVERVYIRDAEESYGTIDRLLYKVESTSDILSDDQFATDREPFVDLTADPESSIYALAFAESSAAGSVSDRIEKKKLAEYIPYTPYCIRRDTEDDPSEFAIDRIGMLSWEELTDLEQRLQDAWIQAAADKILEAMGEALAGEFSEDDREPLYQALEPTIKDTWGYQEYIENQLPGELLKEILSGDTLRLKLTPSDVHRLIEARALDLVGYEAVNREGRWYMRDIADRSTSDNLLELPECE